MKYLHNIYSVHRPAVLGLGAGGEARGPQEEEEVRGGAEGEDGEDGAGAPGEAGLQPGGGQGAAAASLARRPQRQQSGPGAGPPPAPSTQVVQEAAPWQEEGRHQAARPATQTIQTTQETAQGAAPAPSHYPAPANCAPAPVPVPGARRPVPGPRPAHPLPGQDVVTAAAHQQDCLHIGVGCHLKVSTNISR